MIVDTVVKNGTIVGPGKTLENGWVAIDKGKFVAVGQVVEPPEAENIIDVKGDYVLPGMIASLLLR